MEQEKKTFLDIENKMIREHFENHFSEFVTERAHDIWQKIHSRSPELIELQEQTQELHDKLGEGLSKEQSEVFDK